MTRSTEPASTCQGRSRSWYDDSPLARLAHVNLTTVSQNTQQQAEHAVAAAIERLDEGRSAPREVVLPPRLVVRRTVDPPRSAD